MIDIRPGGLDGPPVEQKPTIGELIGRGIGVAVLVIALAFMCVGMVWGIAWMITHFPGV